MTTVIGLILATYFGPTNEQMQYCIEAQWSNEIVIVDNRPTLTSEAKLKSKICDKIIETNLDLLEYY